MKCNSVILLQSNFQLMKLLLNVLLNSLKLLLTL